MKSQFISELSIRPTRHRLLCALGIATVSVAALLGVLVLHVDLDTCLFKPCFEQRERLSVYVENHDVDEGSDLRTGSVTGQPSPQDEPIESQPEPANVLPAQRQEVPVTSAKLVTVGKPVKDWNLLAARTARDKIGERLKREDARAAMWRQTRSVMFKPDKRFEVTEEEPLLANIRFRRPAGVLGLGITIGECFIGLPIAGVPLDKRSTSGLTLVVCASESG